MQAYDRELPESWLEELDEFRNAKNEFFKGHPDSPLSKEEKKKFAGLKYFPPDPEYKLRTVLNRYEVKEVKLKTNKGGEVLFYQVGYFEFKLKGKQVRLYVYRDVEEDQRDLFIPFRDLTSGKETYVMGRYLDLVDEGEDEVVVDFNYSYNPYCAYNKNYTCPIPPQENYIELEIRAGEMNYPRAMA